jgi:hypothetical protein
MTNLAPAYDFGVRACPLRSGGDAPIADRPENAGIALLSLARGGYTACQQRLLP